MIPHSRLLMSGNQWLSNLKNGKESWQLFLNVKFYIHSMGRAKIISQGKWASTLKTVR